MAKMGLHTFAFAPEWSDPVFRLRADQLHALGVGLLEIPLLNPGAIDTDSVRRFAESEGFSVVASLGLPPEIDVVADPETGLAFLEKAFDDCVRIGSSVLSGVTYGTIGRTSGQPPTQAELDGTVRFVARAAKAAARHGLSLGIEPCNRYETHIMNTAAQAAQMIEAAGEDNVFIHLDTYHMHIEERSHAEGFRTAAPYLGYVHLSEANRGVPGHGNVDWRGVFAGLKAVDFDGMMTLESMNYTAPEIASGLAIWRPVAPRREDVVEIGLPFLKAEAENAGFVFEGFCDDS